LEEEERSSGKLCDRANGAIAVPEGTCALPSGRVGHLLRVTTQVDKFGEETSWVIRLRDGRGGSDVVVMSMGPIIP
jgi:hypothetical protein